MIAIIDNYDSFTYNLVQYFGELKHIPEVYRNNEISVPELAALEPRYLVISPGPCTPNEAGISVDAIKYFSDKIPILGVCLGHQSIAQAFGGNIVAAKQLMHGKVSAVRHSSTGLFEGMENPMQATRYHSLAVCKRSLPDSLAITATSEDGEIMGLQHRALPIFGVQFHPESIETIAGKQLLSNFLGLGPLQ
ncbi:MAG: anthranilate synthase component II [Gammaproteobacteria bacterium]